MDHRGLAAGVRQMADDWMPVRHRLQMVASEIDRRPSSIDELSPDARSLVSPLLLVERRDDDAIGGDAIAQATSQWIERQRRLATTRPRPLRWWILVWGTAGVVLAGGIYAAIGFVVFTFADLFDEFELDLPAATRGVFWVFRGMPIGLGIAAALLGVGWAMWRPGRRRHEPTDMVRVACRAADLARWPHHFALPPGTSDASGPHPPAASGLPPAVSGLPAAVYGVLIGGVFAEMHSGPGRGRASRFRGNGAIARWVGLPPIDPHRWIDAGASADDPEAQRICFLAAAECVADRRRWWSGVMGWWGREAAVMVVAVVIGIILVALFGPLISLVTGLSG